MPGGLTEEGLAALDAALARHVERDGLPGLVALVARGDEVHVAARAQGRRRPRADRPGRDLPHRVADQAGHRGGGHAARPGRRDGARRPGRAVAARAGRAAACCGPRRGAVRHGPGGAADHGGGRAVVPARVRLHLRRRRPCPIIKAEAELGLKTLGPPWPPTPLTPDQWIAGLGQPAAARPARGAAGGTTPARRSPAILIERVAGAPLAEVLRERVFEPLGMTDTGFHVPAAKLGRVHHIRTPARRPRDGGGPARCSTGRTAGTPRRPPCPTARAGSSPPSTTWPRSPPCWPPTAAACCRPSRSRLMLRDRTTAGTARRTRGSSASTAAGG